MFSPTSLIFHSSTWHAQVISSLAYSGRSGGIEAPTPDCKQGVHSYLDSIPLRIAFSAVYRLDNCRFHTVCPVPDEKATPRLDVYDLQRQQIRVRLDTGNRAVLTRLAKETIFQTSCTYI